MATDPDMSLSGSTGQGFTWQDRLLTPGYSFLPSYFHFSSLSFPFLHSIFVHHRGSAVGWPCIGGPLGIFCLPVPLLEYVGKLLRVIN